MKPIIKPVGNFGNSAVAPQRPTFGQARAEQMQQQLTSALKERRVLAAAQVGAQQSGNQAMQSALGVRERLSETRIDRLSSQLTASTEPENSR